MSTTITQVATTLLGADLKGMGILGMVLHAGPMVRAIMAGLLGLSLICWGIIVTKTLQLRRVNRESEAFANLFTKCRWLSSLRKEAERFGEGHLAHIFRTGYAELNRVTALLSGRGLKNLPGDDELLLENVGRAVQSGIISKRKRFPFSPQRAAPPPSSDSSAPCGESAC